MYYIFCFVLKNLYILSPFIFPTSADKSARESVASSLIVETFSVIRPKFCTLIPGMLSRISLAESIISKASRPAASPTKFDILLPRLITSSILVNGSKSFDKSRLRSREAVSVLLRLQRIRSEGKLSNRTLNLVDMLEVLIVTEMSFSVCKQND